MARLPDEMFQDSEPEPKASAADPFSLGALAGPEGCTTLGHEPRISSSSEDKLRELDSTFFADWELADLSLQPPHDAFFSAMMAEIEVSRAFFEHFLPKILLDAVDLNQLEILDTKLINFHLSRRQVDKLFRCSLKGENPNHIYLIVEHQSRQDSELLKRVIEYRDIIWARYRNNGEEKPYPLVYAQTLYTGARPYRGSEHLRHLIQGTPEQISLMLDEPLQVIDLQKLDFESINHFPFRITLESFFYAHKDLNTILKWIRKTLASQPLEPLYFDKVVNYLLRATLHKLDAETLYKELNRIFRDEEDKMYANPYVEFFSRELEREVIKGFEDGVEKGVEKGSQLQLEKTVRKMSRMGLDIALIAAANTLTEVEVAEILIREE